MRQLSEEQGEELLISTNKSSNIIRDLKKKRGKHLDGSIV